MKNKLKKALCLGLVLTMFSTTSVMAATYGYSFGLMPENVQNTAYKAKTGSTAYASVHVTKMNYPSASIKYRTHVADKGFTAAYTEQRGLGTCTVIYNKTVKKDENVSLYGYNPSSNGGITVSVRGTWQP